MHQCVSFSGEAFKGLCNYRDQGNTFLKCWARKTNRGSYMSAHFLLNFLNELEKKR